MYPEISRTRERLAYMQMLVDSNVWRLPLGSSGEQRSKPLIFSARHEVSPQYSPDGKKIAFASDRTGNFEIWVCDSEGENATQLTTFRASAGPGSPRWFPDGRRIVFDSRSEGNANIYAINSEGGIPRRITSGSAECVVPSCSRDGKRIYFASNRDGDWQVWKMTLEGDHATQVTRGGGFAPLESPDRKFVYYAKGRDVPGLWRVPTEGGEERPVLDAPRAGYWGYWALGKKGIYWLDFAAAPANIASPALVKFLSFAGGPVASLATIDGFRPVVYPGISVSPDDRWLLYPQLDHASTNIMLVEGFL